MKFSFSMSNNLRKWGFYTPYKGAAFPPFDLISFALRGLHGATKDIFNKRYQDKVIQLTEMLEEAITPFFLMLPKINGGSKGIWFPSERAFSLSPKQFEKFYWPSTKRMIIKFVQNGCIPFLGWESDTTHLVHYLLELPRKIARKCVFQCDSSDILEVNRILDGHMCITGNVPLSTLCVGTPKDVEKYCDKISRSRKVEVLC